MENKPSTFFDDVKSVTRLIPKGRVCTYGDIARYLGSAKSARMVGWALNTSKDEELIPAHRVVNRKGLLTGKKHFGEPNKMQELLEDEGVKILENQIQDLDRILWNPNVELI